MIELLSAELSRAEPSVGAEAPKLIRAETSQAKTGLLP